VVDSVTKKDRGALPTEGFSLRLPAPRLWLMGKGTTGKFVNICNIYVADPSGRAV
jgi:hypothetical protein